MKEYFRIFSGLADSRSRLYGLLSQLYLRPPDLELVQELLSGEFKGLISELLRQPSIRGELKEGLKLLERFIVKWRGKPFEKVLEAMVPERGRLPPPVEASYRGDEKAREVGLLYRRMGVRMAEDVEEPLDHLGFELDFMRFLCGEEAEAWRKGSFEKALNLIGVEDAFLREHLKPWIPSYCDLVFREAKLDFYRGLAKLTKGFLSQDEKLLAEFIEGTFKALEALREEIREGPA